MQSEKSFRLILVTCNGDENSGLCQHLPHGLKNTRYVKMNCKNNTINDFLLQVELALVEILMLNFEEKTQVFKAAKIPENHYALLLK